jgi:hypothetical protein
VQHSNSLLLFSHCSSKILYYSSTLQYLRKQYSQGLLITPAPSGGLLKMLLFLLLFVSISFSQKLKVLYEDGRVGVVDATKTSLKGTPGGGLYRKAHKGQVFRPVGLFLLRRHKGLG